MSLRYLSTFVSHSSHQGDLAHAIAGELGRRGVIAWLDKNELSAGANLDVELRKAAATQLTVTALISKESLASAWCREELEPRLEATGPDESDAIIPVYLGERLTLVRSSTQLRNRWLTPDGTGVRKLGIEAGNSAVDAGEVASRIARAHYKRLATHACTQLVVALDQRGNSSRVGLPGPDLLPRSWQAQPWPVLVFRPDQGERSAAEILHGPAWEGFRDAFVEAMGSAMGTRRSREVYLTGHAQLALAWLAGWYLDRSTQVRLTVYNPAHGGQCLSIDMNDPRFQRPIDGTLATDVTWHEKEPASSAGVVSLYLGAQAFERHVHDYRKAKGDTTPLATKNTGSIENIEDVIGLAHWMSRAAGGRTVRLYTGLPFHAVVVLAAVLKHAIGHLTLMDWDRAASTYRACSMHGHSKGMHA
jgi:hypothetical protein